MSVWDKLAFDRHFDAIFGTKTTLAGEKDYLVRGLKMMRATEAALKIKGALPGSKYHVPPALYFRTEH